MGDTSPLALLVASAEARPGAAAFVDARQQVSYEALAAGARQAAAWLAAQGVAPGDLVALSLDGSPRHSLPALELFYGIGWLGAVVLPLLPEVPAERRAQIVARYGARMVAPGDYRRGAHAVPARGDLPERPFFMQFTSGTTGEPKAVRLTHSQLAARSLTAARALGAGPGDRMAPARIWPGLVGLRTLLQMHSVGACYVNLPFPESREQLAGMIASHGITMITSSPAQIRPLLRTQGPRVELRALFIGGAPVTAQEVRTARESLCRNTWVGYGLNELGMVSVLRPQDPEGVDGFVGTLLPGVQGETDGAELRVRAPWMAQGYLDNPEAGAARYRDGWLYPGDLGSIDAEGRVTLRGRTDDVINYAGVKVVPAEIEAVLLQHPGVADAAVVGLRLEQLGEVPVAFVVARGRASKREVQEYCGRHIDVSRMPRAFVRVDAIPRNTAGKIDRERLRRIPVSSLRVKRGKPA